MKFDIEQYVISNLDKVSKTTSNQLTATCPWCERYGSFYISASSGHFICFKCDARGRGLVGVVAQVEDMTFDEAKRFLLKRSVRFRRKKTPQTLLERIKKFRGKERIEKTKVDFPVPGEFRPVYKGGVWQMPLYLKGRGIEKKTAKEFNLGFCAKGRYAGRIVIPIVCPNGKSFEARSVEKSPNIKTLGPKGADKSRLLIGWKQAKKDQDLVLVEGPFDVMMAHQHGASVLGLGGKNLSSSQFSLLCENWSSEASITIMLDPEELAAPYLAASCLLCYFESVFIALLPDGVDPGSSTRKQFWDSHSMAKQYSGEKATLLKRRVEASRQNLSNFFG